MIGFWANVWAAAAFAGAAFALADAAFLRIVGLATFGLTDGFVTEDTVVSTILPAGDVVTISQDPDFFELS
ncbi:hypothetical protein [Mesorhizobium sp. LjRoot246]|uniref:hypothetical protein n=1 Tax=Mesorhizobium sp. LjRoot246 TaxID=3342294 RepID=UPI003ED1113B